MRKALKALGILLVLVILFIAGAAFYIMHFLPDVGPASDLKIVSTPEKVERGKYLANHVMICMDCHSTRDWAYFAGPMKPDSLGMGGEIFDQSMGFPGSIHAANITPSGIGDWTDGEVFRAVTTGVRKNGKPIFPVMPYHNYGKVDPEDIEAIIAYIRTLPPIEHKVLDSEYDFPMNFIIHTIPEKAEPAKRPSPSDRIAYGKYMVRSASCGECHTPFDKGTFDTTEYAKDAMQKPELKALYASLRIKKNHTAYITAKIDASYPPEITALIIQGYSGKAGSMILVQAKDVIKVKHVKVIVYNATNEVLEAGEAVDNGDGFNWLYTASADVDSINGFTIEARAFDIAGNEAAMAVIVNDN